MYIVFAGWHGDSLRGLDTVMGQYPTLAEAQEMIAVSRNDMGGCDWFELAQIVDGRLMRVTPTGTETLYQFQSA